MNLYRRSDIISLFILIIILASCRKGVDVIPKTEIQNLPTSSTKNLNLVVNDSGLVEMIMMAPLLNQYENVDKPYHEFPSGIEVNFYDGKKEVQASVTAKFAKYIEADQVWELRDSVEVVDNKNVRLETELLFWSQEKDLIYTDRFVKLTNEDQIMTGMGFESDSHLRQKKVKKVWAIIYLNEEVE